jgi:hypothetical protein
LNQYIKTAFENWSRDIGSAYTAIGVPNEFCNEILLLYGFGEQLGGKCSKETNSILFEKKKIPPELIKWASSGIIRI